MYCDGSTTIMWSVVFKDFTFPCRREKTVLSGNQSPICNMRDADPLYESGYRKKKNEKEKKNGT